MKKVSLSFLLIIAFVGVLVVIRNVFFVDEFVYILIEKSNEDIVVVKEPQDWKKDELSRFTSIQATFRNTTDQTCGVTLSPAKEDESFNVEGHQEFGTFLPKVDVVKIIFCDEQVALQL